MRVYQNNCDFQYGQNFYVHLVEHTPNTKNPTFVFIQYLSILGCRASKAKIRFFDFFGQSGQRSKIITFEPDIEFKIFFFNFSKSAHSITPNQGYFVKKKTILIARWHGDLYGKNVFFGQCCKLNF